MMTDDTIAAISTPIGEGGIAIIRISGPAALSVADAMFVSRKGKPSTFATHTIHPGHIARNGETIDQVLLAVMRQPSTYTGEDVVEINCHGGVITAQRVLQLCLSHGARLAEPGEFTKRAFLNGKMDLTQAESVMDLIHARTERAQTIAAHVMEGHLSVRVNRLRDDLTTILAHIEAHIDFPDEDISPQAADQLREKLRAILGEIELLLATAREGTILREGIPVVIIGRPNAGKSSVMNALLGQERSIVTPIAGTTRDTIEEYANVRGIPIRFTDTAGMRQARGKVEKAGVERSHKALTISTIAIHIIDASRPLHASDQDLRKSVVGKTSLIALNKIDLPRRFKLPEEWADCPRVEISTKTGQGIEQLKDALIGLIWSGRAGNLDLDVAINERHARALELSKKTLTEAEHRMTEKENLEVIAQLLRIGLDQIGEIVGKTTTEDILTKIFSTFCIGK